MQENNRIPRWLIENDPSWEKSIDSDLGLLKWTKKGTGVQATCQPTNMFCYIVGNTDGPSLGDIGSASRAAEKHAAFELSANDITKYLSSRYLNPGINSPYFDLRKVRKI